MAVASVEPTPNGHHHHTPPSTDHRFFEFVELMFGARNAKFWRDCAAAGKVSPHPVWEIAPDRVVSPSGRIALLGDAAHMAR